MVSQFNTFTGVTSGPSPCTNTCRVWRHKHTRQTHNKLKVCRIKQMRRFTCLFVFDSVCVLTSTEYSTSSPSSPVSFSVYLAFFILASTGPFSTWCFKALYSLYKGSPAVSWNTNSVRLMLVWWQSFHKTHADPKHVLSFCNSLNLSFFKRGLVQQIEFNIFVHLSGDNTGVCRWLLYLSEYILMWIQI